MEAKAKDFMMRLKRAGVKTLAGMKCKVDRFLAANAEDEGPQTGESAKRHYLDSELVSGVADLGHPIIQSGFYSGLGDPSSSSLNPKFLRSSEAVPTSLS